MDRQKQIQENKRKYYREYMREYRKKNKEKIQEYADRYWARVGSIEVRNLETLEAELNELKYRAQ